MAAVKKPKWYVVWVGSAPGVYSTWAIAEKQIHGFPGARYKSYESREEAEAAFAQGSPPMVPKGAVKKPRVQSHNAKLPSISVDAACDMTTGVMEYRGVDTATGGEIFRMGPYQGSSNNLGEFLAIVHALAHCQAKGLVVPIYSDSRTALSWVRNRKIKSTVQRTAANAPVFDLIDRAERWLSNNNYANPVLKWETSQWGENPADFGRK
ncbi:MAG: ribonuclease H [Candidatus Kapabacteria bacterium]|nr:ribonuclease H [Candidatus Kapabacteria bacterium]